MTARQISWIISALMLLAYQTQAQESAPKASEAAGRRAWVVVTDIPDDVENPLPVLSGKKLYKLQMYLRSIGDPIPVDETGMVSAVKEQINDKGEVTYKNLSQSTVPEGVNEALIVLVPDEKNESGLRFRSKVIDLAKFKKGGCLYINLVRTKIGITIGELKTVVEPGGMEFINPLEGEKSGVFPVRFFYEIPKEPTAEWKLMTSSKMQIFESRREICIFYYNEKIENVDFRGIPFMTPLPPPEKNPKQ